MQTLFFEIRISPSQKKKGDLDFEGAEIGKDELAEKVDKDCGESQETQTADKLDERDLETECSNRPCATR